MRALAIAWLCAACGGAIEPAPPAPRVARIAIEPDRPPVDPIAALALDDAAEVSWVVPGPMQLELGGERLPAGGSGRPIQVVPIDRQGSLVRVAVRLDHARFSLWIDRAHVLSVLRRDQRIEPVGPPAVGSDIEVIVRAGAIVARLAHRDHATRIRYVGALEIEGWVPDAVLGDRGRPRDPGGRIPTGRRTKMVVPGAVIRSEPRWASGALATMATGYFLDTVRELDDAWTEVSYEDGDVAVHGYVSQRDPPGRLHPWRETDATPTTAPNATLASGTCLYARPRGEAIGYVVGDRPVALEGAEDAGEGWWMATLDTPWGPLGFAVRGARRAELTACAPPGAVPAP